MVPRASIRQLDTSIRHLNDVTHGGVDVGVPAAAAENAVVADAGLYAVLLHMLTQPGTKVLRGERLTEAANIVPLPLDGQQRGALDGARIDAAAMHLELAERQKVILKNRFHRFEIELGRQIHDREIFLVKFLNDLKLG